jgi:predicted amidohydrolase
MLKLSLLKLMFPPLTPMLLAGVRPENRKPKTENAIDGKVSPVAGKRKRATGAVEVDGHGGYLLPGFIDAHIHLMGIESLNELLKYGVTTALDMGCWPAARVNEDFQLRSGNVQKCCLQVG